MMRSALLLLTFFASLFAPATLATAPPPSPALAEDPFEVARELLKDGKLGEARKAAIQALQATPYAVDGYALLREISSALEDDEEQLRWGKWEWWSRKYTGELKDPEKLADDLSKLWEDWNQDGIILEEWEAQLATAAQKAASKKYYRLAGHLMDKLLALNVDDTKLEKEYDKLAKKAGEQLSGGAFAAASIRRKTAQWLAKQNEKHEDWKNPFERKTKHYDLYTNISWEFAETAAAAMDEVNEFYRSIYDYKKRAKAKIYCWKKRSDFDRFTMKLMKRAMESRGVGGYWAPGQRTVVAYDRSYDEEGQTQDAIWKTLFHEASHQFMTLLTKGRIDSPVWLDEGTSSYFEGCVIKADGTIVKNNPARQRLRSWYMLDTSDRRHSLEDLIAHIRNLGPDKTGMGSYEGEYYPYGWALVYFLLNYEENDRRVYGTPITPDGRVPSDYKAVKKAGRLVYRDAYQKYLAHFSKNGCDGDRYYPLEIAKKYFVEEIDDPDVPDWEAFEARWRKFTTSLYQEQEEMGMEFADVLQARSRGYLMAEDYERARITAEQADDKREEDAETYRLLALANQGEGRKEDAIFWMIRHWEIVWPAGKSELADSAEEWLASNGAKDFVKQYLTPTKEAVVKLQSLCAETASTGYPKMATLFALHGTQVFGTKPQGLVDFLNLDLEKEEEGGPGDYRMWQAAYNKGVEGNRRFVTPELSTDIVTYESDGVLINNPEGRARSGLEYTDMSALRELKPPYEIRGSVIVDGGWGELFLGLDHRRVPKGALLFGTHKENQVVRFDTMKLRTDANSGTAFFVHDQVGGLQFKPEGEIRFHIRIFEDGLADIKINDLDVLALPEDFDTQMWTGSFAISSDDGTISLWKNFEVRPNSAFWPVP
ncbi:MAG: hypothetical protein CMJ96_06435 [Planctomycetes bacterium]|nr:hypothetical protein [Planctomycetota bacterium]